MTTWQTAAILKTDLESSTTRFRQIPATDLDPLLTSHRELLTRACAARGGRIVQPAGDGFWMVFPSVTAAALAALTMQEELRLSQPNVGEDRLSMRIVISVGDVLLQDAGPMGDAVVLAARIEDVTPPDEIYLSAAARLAIHKAEIRTAYVDAYSFEGFPEPEPVYRVVQSARMRVLENQYIVVTDLHGFVTALDETPIAVVEAILDRMADLVGETCREYRGVKRFGEGDAYCMTFPEADLALEAGEHFARAWGAFVRGEGLACPINVVIHKGRLYAFRSYLCGAALTLAFEIDRATHAMPPMETWIFVSGPVREDLAGSRWEARLRAVEPTPPARPLDGLSIYRLH